MLVSLGYSVNMPAISTTGQVAGKPLAQADFSQSDELKIAEAQYREAQANGESRADLNTRSYPGRFQRIRVCGQRTGCRFID